jgi:hypothetical protein
MRTEFWWGTSVWKAENEIVLDSMDGIGSGSCPVAGFGISGVEPSGFMS